MVRQQTDFFGDGLKADRLVSYAASFGNHSAWDGIDPGWANKLQQFSAISVRDENSRVLVKDGLEREPAVVLDPCLQFPELAAAEPVSSGDYALLYGYGFPRMALGTCPPVERTDRHPLAERRLL